MPYLNRFLQPLLEQALATMPAVFLNGPRQAGKSTLVQHVAELSWAADYVSMDDMTTLAIATSQPESFLKSFQRPVIIDEIQLAPELFRPLKRVIDELRHKDPSQANGRFLLTGSANILTLPDLAQALVGRMHVLSLYPLSGGEALQTNTANFLSWLAQPLAFTQFDFAISLEEMIKLATFPHLVVDKTIDRALWFNSYLTTLLQRDVRQLAEIDKLSSLPNILKILATRAGSLLNDADCARDASINAMTYRRYRTLLQQLFLITTVAPWFRNINKRLVKAPKLYFTDTALLCHQLGVELDALKLQQPNLFGHILENFVASELIKHLTLSQNARLFHFRTHDQKEVDFLIEYNNGEILAIEVKGRDHIRPADFAELQALKKILGKKFIRGIVFYIGTQILSFGDEMWAVPIQCFGYKISS